MVVGIGQKHGGVGGCGKKQVCGWEMVMIREDCLGEHSTLDCTTHERHIQHIRILNADPTRTNRPTHPISTPARRLAVSLSIVPPRSADTYPRPRI